MRHAIIVAMAVEFGAAMIGDTTRAGVITEVSESQFIGMYAYEEPLYQLNPSLALLNAVGEVISGTGTPFLGDEDDRGAAPWARTRSGRSSRDTTCGRKSLVV